MEELDSVDLSRNEFSGRIDLKSLEELPDLTGQIHHLPCCIKHNGPADVFHYFKPKKTGVVVDGLEIEEGSFRGRKLQGTTVQMPEGYRGFVLGRTGNLEKGKDSKACEENSNCWEARAKFENITYWNHDSLPSHDDAFLRCFHWFSVANALHMPVTSSDLSSTSNSRK